MTIDSATESRFQSEINITPMIDVLLVLLIIFMVIVPATPRGEAALMPHPASETSLQPGPVVLEVLKASGEDAAFRINQQAITRAELPARLGEIFAKRAQRVLFVKGDDQLIFRQIAEVIDVSHAAGVDHVCLMTSKAKTL